MPVIPAGYAQANHVIALTGDPELMMVTLGIKFGTVTLADLPGIANNLFDSWCDAMEAHISNAYTLMGVSLHATLGSDAFVIDSTAAPRPGVNTGTPITQNTAILIQKRTNQGGRSRRGRMFHPGAPEANIGTTGGLTAQYMTDLQTAVDFWLTRIQAVAGVDDAVVLHSGPPEIDPTVITSFRVDGLAATQRRRLR